MTLRRWLSAALLSVSLLIASVCFPVSTHAQELPADIEAAKAELVAIQDSARQVYHDLAESKRKLEQAKRDLEITKQDLGDQEELVAKMRVQAGRVATAAHQRGEMVNMAGIFFSADSEQSFIDDVAVMQSMTMLTDEQLARLGAEEARLKDLQAEQDTAVATISEEVDKQTKLSKEYEAKAADAKSVLARLDAEKQAQLTKAMNDAIIAEAQANIQLASSRVSRGDFKFDAAGGVWPAEGPITSPFGYRNNPIGGYSELHDGTDVGAPCGAPVRSSWSGVVVTAGVEGGWGNRVIVDSGTYKAAYNHLSSISVSVGQVVDAGQIVGAVGTTGWSTGCHLHFSVWVDGQITDPQSLFGI